MNDGEVLLNCISDNHMVTLLVVDWMLSFRNCNYETLLQILRADFWLIEIIVFFDEFFSIIFIKFLSVCVIDCLLVEQIWIKQSIIAAVDK